jgi:uncharacterized protein YraI
MRFQAYVLAMLVPLALVSSIPNAVSAQGAPAVAAIPQLKGGVATVIAVDQPENCLRIRSGPGSSYDVIGCAAIGQQLNLTGVWTSNEWAQLAGNGWVYGPQIQTDLRPPVTAFSEPQAYVAIEEGYPVYDYGYLPDYGYSTYWYTGIPIIVYATNVWWRHHPWWSKPWAHGHKVWNGNRNFQTNVRTRSNVNTTAAPRSFTPRNSSSFSSTNITRFNTNTFRSGAASVARSAGAFSRPSTFRTFSSPNTFRTGNFGVRQFRGAAGPSFGGRGHRR